MSDLTRIAESAPGSSSGRGDLVATESRPAADWLRRLAVSILPTDGMTLAWTGPGGEFVIQFAQRLPADGRGLRRLSHPIRIIVMRDMLEAIEGGMPEERALLLERFREWLEWRLSRHTPASSAIFRDRPPAEWRFRADAR